jgi:hypothetical protein
MFKVLRYSSRSLPVAWQHINLYGHYEFSKRPELINRSYAIVEDRKNKGIESYIGGKDLCLSHFGYTS